VTNHDVSTAQPTRSTASTRNSSSARGELAVFPLTVLPVITDLAPDPAYYTDQPTPASSGWNKNSANSRAQHQRHRHQLRRAIPRLSALPHQQRRTPTLQRFRACNDLTQARRVGIRLLCKARGRLRLGLRRPEGRLRPIMVLRVLVMMVLSMSGGIIGGLRRSGRL